MHEVEEVALVKIEVEEMVYWSKNSQKQKNKEKIKLGFVM